MKGSQKKNCPQKESLDGESLGKTAGLPECDPGFAAFYLSGFTEFRVQPDSVEES